MDRFVLYNATNLNVDFNIPGLNVNSFSSQVASSTPIILDDGSPINIASMHPGITAYYNTTQLNIMNNYFNSMRDITTGIQALAIYTNAKNATNGNTSLSRDQKVAVLAPIEYAQSFAMSFVGGGSTGMEIDISVETGLPNQSAACDIRWRDVWRSAVWSGFGSAIAGGIIGGTAGSFTVPLLGTATGWLGGAVFGFAAGFSGGAVGNVAYQYVWNCLFNSPTSAPPTACNDPAFAIANAEYCGIDAPYVNLKWYLLNN